MSTLDSAFFALADPTRRAIIAQLTKGEATVLELAKPFAISQPAITRHLKVLEEAGLIRRWVDRNRRPCALVKERLDEMDEWIEKMRDAMESNYSRLDQLIKDQEI